MSDMMTFPATDKNVGTSDDCISRQAAIMDAESWVAVDEYEKNLQKKVIEWLKEFPPAELGADTISRQAAIDAINCDITITGRQNAELVAATIGAFVDRIKALPPAQPKRGKWIKTARWGRVYYCNQCRNYLDFDGVNAGRGSTNFCPNCGADMRGEQDDS